MVEVLETMTVSETEYSHPPSRTDWSECAQGSLEEPSLALDYIHHLECGENTSQVDPSCGAFETVGGSGWPANWDTMLEGIEDIGGKQGSACRGAR